MKNKITGYLKTLSIIGLAPIQEYRRLHGIGKYCTGKKVVESFSPMKQYSKSQCWNIAYIDSPLSVQQMQEGQVVNFTFPRHNITQYKAQNLKCSVNLLRQ